MVTNFEADIMTLFGKPINKMSFAELRREREMHIWFAKRMDYLAEAVEYDVSQREHLRKDSEPIIKELDEKYESGEISQHEYFLQKGAYTKKLIALERTEHKAEFIRMIEYQHRAYLSLLDERLAIIPRPRHKRRKPRTSIYRKNNFKAYVSTSRRWRKFRDVDRMFQRWQNAQDKRSLGELWNRERFLQICADRGFVSELMIQQMFATELDTSMTQAHHMLKVGSFSWLQIMKLGAELQLTPTEFAECFMCGYFKEIGNGLYQATDERLPKDDIPESADDKSGDS